MGYLFPIPTHAHPRIFFRATAVVGTTMPTPTITTLYIENVTFTFKQLLSQCSWSILAISD